MFILDKEKSYFDGAFDNEVAAGEKIQAVIGNLRITAKIKNDDGVGAPWEHYCGHGIVSDWTTSSKEPGQRILNEDHGSYRYYDVARTMTIAKRDGWGVADSEGMTRGQIAAAAVEADFENMRAWCNDEWRWVGVVLSVEAVWEDEDGDENAVEILDHAASLWGIESNAGSHLTDTAEELLHEAIAATETRLGTMSKAITAALSTLAPLTARSKDLLNQL